MRKALWAVAFLMAMWTQVASAQIWDRSGNSMLSGAWSFRNTVYLPNSDGTLSDAYGIFGSITFDGRGNYTLSATGFQASTGGSGTFSATGTYSLGANGYGIMKHPVAPAGNVNILLSNGVLVGSSPEALVNDLFFAVPSGPQNNAMFNGQYSLAYLNVGAAYTSTYNTMAAFTANGNGGIGSVPVKSYLGSQAAPINQTENSVTYSFANNTGTLKFPTSPSNIPLKGNLQFYISADGNFIFGGAPNGIDTFVGVRRGGGTPPAMSGLYYSVGANHIPGDLDSFFGSFFAYDVQGAIWDHQRGLLSYMSTPDNYTAAGTFPTTPQSDYTDTASFIEYTVAQNAQFRIGIGQSPYMTLRVAMKAPTFTAPAGTTPWINPTGIQNSASSAPFTAGLSHGELMTIYGANLAPSTVITQGGVPFQNSLSNNNVQVLMNNKPAALYYVTPTQIAAIVPYGIPDNIVQVQVVNNGVSSNAVTAFLYKTGPGLFSESTQGQGLAKILHADYRQVTPNNPAVPGEVLQVFMTGLGDVFPSIADGALGPSPQFSEAVASISAAIDNLNAPVQYAGLAPGLAGLYQVNITVPQGVSNGDVYVDISGPDSYTSQVTIPIVGGVVPREARAPVRRR